LLGGSALAITILLDPQMALLPRLGFAVGAYLAFASYLPLIGRSPLRTPLATWGMAVAHCGIAVALIGMAANAAFTSERLGVAHVRGNIWRYEPGAAGRRHRHPIQEETFVVLSGAVLLGLGLFLASRAQSPLQFQLAFGLLVGIAIGSFFSPMIAAVMGWMTEHRGLAVALVSVGVGVAPMTMSPFAAWLITQMDWRSAQLVLAVVVWATLVPAALFVRRPPAAPAAAQGAVAEGPTLKLRALSLTALSRRALRPRSRSQPPFWSEMTRCRMQRAACTSTRRRTRSSSTVLSCSAPSASSRF